MRQLLHDPRFALGEMIFVILCGVVWIVTPHWGIWFILIVLSLFFLKAFTGNVEFSSNDWLILVFLVTAWIGYWAAYDRAIAWSKAWSIVTGVLLYYSMRSQPKENLTRLSFLLFSIGIGVSLYYFLTYDFVAAPRRLGFINNIGRWIMSIRPQMGWTPIHPNYVAGVVAITVSFIFYPVMKLRIESERASSLLYGFIIAGLSIAFLALVMATSRGVIMALVSGVGGWLVWRLIQLDGIKRFLKSEAAFSILLLLYLGVIAAFLYAGPAQYGSISSTQYYFGNGSRAELFSRSLYLILDYPITGGGLGSFPGLYSQYILNIPFFNVPNSHNLFLDVAIEQGLFGGLSYSILYVIGVWTLSSSIIKTDGNRVFQWIVLFSLIVAIVHGMVDDYLYNSVGSILSLFLIGLSLNEKQHNHPVNPKLVFRTISAIFIVLALIAFINLNFIRSIWYANLGAIQLTKVELDGFPDNGWTGIEMIPKLEMAEATLHSALQFDPANRTANQRLGMIAMLRHDYAAAVGYLETAKTHTPKHRGIIKSLGYSYTWLGDVEMAQISLLQIPEAREELNVYVSWWKTRGRDDLSEKALNMFLRLEKLLYRSEVVNFL